MNVEDIRNRQRSSPEWLAVELMQRIEALEAKVEQMSNPPKRARQKKVNNGAYHIR